MTEMVSSRWLSVPPSHQFCAGHGASGNKVVLFDNAELTASDQAPTQIKGNDFEKKRIFNQLSRRWLAFDEEMARPSELLSSLDPHQHAPGEVFHTYIVVILITPLLLLTPRGASFRTEVHIVQGVNRHSVYGEFYGPPRRLC